MYNTWRKVQRPLIGLLFAILVLFIPPVRNRIIVTLSPLVVTTRHVGESVFDFAQLIASIPTLSSENGSLRSHINELQALEVKQKELAHENELLRKELNLSPAQSDTLIAAQVISRASSVSQQQIVINKGTKDGFTTGMAVVAQGYFIGQVEEALESTSRIDLITSVRSLVPVVLQTSRSVGLLKGGAEGLVIDEIPRDVTIDSGEALVTANLGNVVRGGLPVGTVSAVLSGKSDVFQSARIHSPIDFSRLEVVFGVK
ncbi:MAG TPA: rod shape-determining protein MreC [Patescibacteria group bacterium]